MAKTWILVLVLCACTVSMLFAQPNCRDVNLSVDELGMTNFAIGDLVSDLGGVTDATVTFEKFNGEVVFGPMTAEALDPLNFAACAYLGDSLKARVQNSTGSCWSVVSFKKTFGPAIRGRVYNVYCFDPLVERPQDSGPDLLFSCDRTLGGVKYVADWITDIPCESPAQDTAKIIYREWEKVDKDGIRGVGFDTIYVFNLPEITINNFYCEDRDTIYCSATDELKGPFFTFPKTPGDPMVCDTIFLLEYALDTDGQLSVTNTKFEDKCGLASKVEVIAFHEDDCVEQYKITVDLKHECFGLPQTSCVVSPPAGTGRNTGELIAPGYWRCTTWLIDYDTLPPEIHCKYPLLFTGEFAPARWTADVEGDGSVDLVWSPYNIKLIGNNNGDDDLETNYCLTLTKDTVINFAWEYRSQNSGPEYDPFGFTLNGDFFQLSKDDGELQQNGHKIIELKSGDVFCFSQRSEDGIVGRASTAIKPLTIVSTSSGECAAHAYLPRVDVRDDWSGVKAVKARIENVGTYVLEYDADEDCYLTHDQPKLPYAFEPYQIVYSAFDSCHNIALDTCYILVKDAVRPVVHADKGLTVGLTNKKVWVPAEDFDEQSFDNCGVNMVLVRRTDWYESCIDLCDDRDSLCLNKHGEVLWKANLEEDKEIDEVEAHYAKTLRWLSTEGLPCANLLYNAWQYDLIKYATQLCDEHPYPIDDHYVRGMMKECPQEVSDCFLYLDRHPDPYDPEDPEGNPNALKYDDRLLEVYEQIGGGWSKEVAFDCEDACGQVTVEILVMDFWCNWNTGWTQVWVEDKVPPVVVRDVDDAEITCKAYRTKRYDVAGETHPVSLEEIVERAKGDDQGAYDALDGIFGGYQKVWQGQYGYVDINGDPVENDIAFSDSTCYCRLDDVIRTRIRDEHTNEYYWKLDSVYDCGYDEKVKTFQQGQVLANCPNYVGCDQEIWCELDHCGEGVIYRKFKIWTGCPPSFFDMEGVPDSLIQKHQADTLERLQKIVIYNECQLDPHQFDIPRDTEVEDCGLVLDSDGSTNISGAAHPDNTGWLRHQFDDDCRLVGIGYEDKVFNIVGGDGVCYKIQRTWYYMDWCEEGQPTEDQWWSGTSSNIGTFTQHILLTDTTPPVCTIRGLSEEGGVVEVGTCAYNLSVDVDVEDACGVSSYYWELKEVKGSVSSVFASGQGGLSSEASETFTISTPDVPQGAYKLKVRVVDDCTNESYCEYNFTVKQVKKPTAICILHLTAKLTAMDLDQDAVVDTAMATIWGREFNSSSLPACEDIAVAYRIERLDGVDDDTFDDDGDSLEVGCTDIGSQMVRLWVISLPSGAVDYCDVILNVQAPESGCPDNSNTSESTETVAIVSGVSQEAASSSGASAAPQLKLNSGGQGSRGGSAFEVSQNVPNPFIDETMIQFMLTDASVVTFEVYNLAGQMIATSQQAYGKGLQQITIDKEILPGPGVYLYRLESKGAVATKRMVALE